MQTIICWICTKISSKIYILQISRENIQEKTTRYIVEEMFCWNLHQIYVKIFGVEIKFNDKNCKRNRKEIEHKMEKKNYPLFDYNSVLVFVLYRTIQYWLRFFPKKPIQLFINLCDSETIHCKRDLDDSISCSYYKKRVMMLKVSLTTKCMSASYISLIKIKPSISICSCTSDDSILLNYIWIVLNVEIFYWFGLWAKNIIL